VETPREPFAQEEVVGSEHPDDFLAGHRAYLVMLARTRLPDWLRRWLDYSDVLHETLANAYRRRDLLAAMVPAQRAGYLEKILQHVLCDAVRKHWRERPAKFPPEEWETSVSLFWPAPDTDQSSPSEHAMHKELLVELADALAQLSERERTAVEMRYLRRPVCSLEKIGLELQCTQRGAGGLLCRGLNKLRQLLRKSQL
jgi:RNA polymerase sigma factor (sigma-70 family)